MGYRDNIAGRRSKSLKLIDGEVSKPISAEEYSKFTDNTRVQMNKAIELVYKSRASIYPEIDGNPIINKKTDKPYTKKEWELKSLDDINNGIEGLNRVEIVSKNDPDRWDEYPEVNELGEVIGESELEKEKEKYKKKIRNAFFSIYNDEEVADRLTEDIISK